MSGLMYGAGITDTGAYIRNSILLAIIIAALSGGIAYYLGYSEILSIACGAVVFIIIIAARYASVILKAAKRVEHIEEILPDFLSLMSSNLRSGLTPDRAFLLSVRREFGPLETEVDYTAKEIVSGKPFTTAFSEMAKRINSEVFSKATRLIIEGVRSGGNLAELLENTSLDIRRFSAIREEVSATVKIYELFIIAAAAIGAPLLYAVASFLVDVIAELKDEMQMSGTATAASYMPMFNGGAGMLSPEIIFYFSLVAIAITAFFGALTAGVISKGKESAGYMYVPILMVIAYLIFFSVKFLLEKLLGGFFL